MDTSFNSIIARGVLALIFYVAAVSITVAQTDELFDKTITMYPHNNSVFLEQRTVLTIDVENDSLKTFTEVFEDVIHLKDQSEYYGSKKVHGSMFAEVTSLEAKTLVWEKNKYKLVKVSNFKKNSNSSGSVFYDDSYFYSFDLPSVAPHNRTQIQYKQIFRDPRMLPVHFFQNYLPVIKSSFVIKAPIGVELNYKILNAADNPVTFKKTTKGKYIYYEWLAENAEPIKIEEKGPSIHYYCPQLVYSIRSFKGQDDKIHEVLPDLHALHAWYQTFTKHLNKNNSSKLQEVVNAIKSKSASDLELVKNIFYWAQNNIEYIAFEDGMQGFVPREATFTFEKRYGDCKDMANLIVVMLELAGKRAYHTWIGSRDLPYKYSEFSTPIVDNHMIATYISDSGEYYYLDATSDYTQFGFPSSMIQGKEALIAIDADKFEIKTIPVIERERNITTDSMKLTLVNNDIVGTGKSRLVGFHKAFSGPELDRSEDSDIKKYVTKLIGKGSNKFYLDDFKLYDILNQDKATRVDYDFRISDYFQKIDDEIYINLNLSKDYFNHFVNRDTRKTAIEMDYQYIRDEVIELKIPEGYKIQYQPADFQFNGAFLGANLKYVNHGDGRVTLHKQFFMNSIMVDPKNFENWNEDVKNLSECYKESVILKKKL